MIDLFRKKSTPGPGQDSSSLPAKTKDTKREYSYLLEFRCRGQLFATLETNTVKEGVLRIGKNPGNDLVIPDTDRISSEKHLELHFFEFDKQDLQQLRFYQHLVYQLILPTYLELIK